MQAMAAMLKFNAVKVIQHAEVWQRHQEYAYLVSTNEMIANFTKLFISESVLYVC